jgi:hypothetical protein
MAAWVLTSATPLMHRLRGRLSTFISVKFVLKPTRRMLKMDRIQLLVYRTVEKLQNAKYSECYTPLSEPFGNIDLFHNLKWSTTWYEV